MAIIAPCITALTLDDYAQQLAKIEAFAQRLHIDLADGDFAPVSLVPPQNVHWPKTATADIHVMYQQPLSILETLISLHAQTLILQIEADDVMVCLQNLTQLGVRRGLSLLPDTPAEALKPFLEFVDHVLIFSGDLGHFGGKVNTAHLSKVAEIKSWRSELEIGWDGGVNADNARQLMQGGVDVLNSGGFIQKSDDPQRAYQQLVDAIS